MKRTILAAATLAAMSAGCVVAPVTSSAQQYSGVQMPYGQAFNPCAPTVNTFDPSAGYFATPLICTPDAEVVSDPDTYLITMYTPRLDGSPGFDGVTFLNVRTHKYTGPLRMPHDASDAPYHSDQAVVLDMRLSDGAFVAMHHTVMQAAAAPAAPGLDPCAPVRKIMDPDGGNFAPPMICTPGAKVVAYPAKFVITMVSSNVSPGYDGVNLMNVATKERMPTVLMPHIDSAPFHSDQVVTIDYRTSDGAPVAMHHVPGAK